MPHNKAKTVLITGATSGIGKEIARVFAQNGWNLVLHYHSLRQEAKRLKGALMKLGVQCEITPCDFSSQTSVVKFADKMATRQIDSLINNAGSYVVNKHFSELSSSEINMIFQINVFSHMVLSSGIFMYMKKQSFGRIVNISSISAKYGGSANSLAYGASKRALEGLTKTLAKEGAAYNVLVNTVRPGVIDTDFHKKFPKDMGARIAMIPAKRMGQPTEVARVVYFLGSQANSFITNEIIAVSGGE
jgi:NAD(P)-dependent dehydrogenase (short-subunit alcohol dehydrogenase family)